MDRGFAPPSAAEVLAAAADGGEAHVLARCRLSRPPVGQPPAQRRPVRVWRLKVLALVDLPVD